MNILTKVCKRFDRRKDDDKEGEEYLQWQLKHAANCKRSHEGSTPSMEPKGGINIFGRSEALHCLHYLGYAGDGDTKFYSSVVSSDPIQARRSLKRVCRPCPKEDGVSPQKAQTAKGQD